MTDGVIKDVDEKIQIIKDAFKGYKCQCDASSGESRSHTFGSGGCVGYIPDTTAFAHMYDNLMEFFKVKFRENLMELISQEREALREEYYLRETALNLREQKIQREEFESIKKNQEEPALIAKEIDNEWIKAFREILDNANKNALVPSNVNISFENALGSSK